MSTVLMRLTSFWQVSRSAQSQFRRHLHVEGIRHIGADDILFAEELGYRIKLEIANRTDRRGAKGLPVHGADGRAAGAC